MKAEERAAEQDRVRQQVRGDRQQGLVEMLLKRQAWAVSYQPAAGHCELYMPAVSGQSVVSAPLDCRGLLPVLCSTTMPTGHGKRLRSVTSAGWRS